MDKIAWYCLPKGTKTRIKRLYSVFSKRDIFLREKELLESLFGKHNILSTQEFPELLYVEREKVINYYLEYKKAWETEENPDIKSRDYGKLRALEFFFGDKCLPGEEKEEVTPEEDFRIIGFDEFLKEESIMMPPKFCKGEKVVTPQGEEYIIKEVHKNGKYFLEGSDILWEENLLEPYGRKSLYKIEILGDLSKSCLRKLTKSEATIIKGIFNECGGKIYELPSDQVINNISYELKILWPEKCEYYGLYKKVKETYGYSDEVSDYIAFKLMEKYDGLDS